MSYSIIAEGLVKRFAETTALTGIDLNVRTGTVFGLLGPNGADKTTAVRILATLLKPDGGHAPRRPSADQLTRPQRQHDQQRAQPGTAHVEDGAVLTDPDLKRPEHRYPHTPILPRRQQALSAIR